MRSIHPSSINAYPICEGSPAGGAWALFQLTMGARWVPHTHIHTSMDNIESPIHLILPVFGLWEETWVCGGNSLNKVFYFIFSLSFQYSKHVVLLSLVGFLHLQSQIPFIDIKLLHIFYLNVMVHAGLWPSGRMSWDWEIIGSNLGRVIDFKNGIHCLTA